MLTPSLLTETTADRAEAFCTAFGALAGYEPVRVAAAGFSPASGAEALATHMAADTKCDGLFAVTDTLALGAYRAIKGRGRRVPQDVSVVGVGDSENADFFDPTLTCVGPDYDQVVAEIVALLFNLMSRRRVKLTEVFVPPAVTLRVST